jgi:hypothetical protein
MRTHTDTNWENGEPVPSNESHLGGGRGEFLEQLQRDFSLTEPEAIELLAFCEENIGQKISRPVVNGAKYAVDPLRVKLLDLIELLLEVVKGNACEQRVKAVFWCIGDAAVDDSLGHWCPAEGARREGVKKYTMYKAADGFAERLGLPPRDDQRSDESREKMSNALKAKYEEHRG